MRGAADAGARAPRAWRLLETGPSPGAWNMACDLALLEAFERGAGEPTLRLYGWSPPAVSLGRHQPDPEPAAAARLAALGVDWVRRPTGGRAVFHGPPEHELTYSVAARFDDPALDGGAAEAYRRIHAGIVAGLTRIGVNAGLRAPDPAARRAQRVRPTSRLACFAASVPWEVTAGGRKLVGSAQRRGRVAFLQHGSIPLAGSGDVLSRVWPGSIDPARATTVSAAAGRTVGFDEAAAAIMAGIAETLAIELRPPERSGAARVGQR